MHLLLKRLFNNTRQYPDSFASSLILIFSIVNSIPTVMESEDENMTSESSDNNESNYSSEPDNSENSYTELSSVYQMRKYLKQNSIQPVCQYVCPSTSCAAIYTEEELPSECSKSNCRQPLDRKKLKNSGHFLLYLSFIFSYFNYT